MPTNKNSRLDRLQDIHAYFDETATALHRLYAQDPAPGRFPYPQHPYLKRVQTVLQDALAQAQQTFQQPTPDAAPQRAEALYRLLCNNLIVLEQMLEQPLSRYTSWENPLLEIHYPVTVDWARLASPWAKLESNLSQWPVLNQTINDTLQNKPEFSGFYLPGQAKVRLIRGGQSLSLALDLQPVFDDLAQELGPSLDAFPGLRLPTTPAVSRQDVATAYLKYLKENLLPMGNALGVVHRGTIRQQELNVVVLTEFHPLVLNLDTRQAYFMCMFGLLFQRDTPNPAPAWTPEEKRLFLDGLLKEWLDTSQGAVMLPSPALKLSMTTEETARQRWAAVTTLLPEEIGQDRQGLGVAFGTTRIDTGSLNISRALDNIRLPRKWDSLPRWQQLVTQEIEDIRAREGERAFEPLHALPHQSDVLVPLLKRRYKPNGGEIVTLTAAASQDLRQRWGQNTGFIERDSLGDDFLTKLHPVGSKGWLEVGISWHGLAQPVSSEWREQRREALQQLQPPGLNPEDLDDKDREEYTALDRALQQLRYWEAGRRVMSAVLAQIAVQGHNPVEVPAEAFRVLLWPERARRADWPTHWREILEHVLSSLTKLTFRYRTYRMTSFKGYGNAFAEWKYRGAGKGEHSEGTYTIWVSASFVGYLRRFIVGQKQLLSGTPAEVFNFSHKLDPEAAPPPKWESEPPPASIASEPEPEEAADTYTLTDAGRPFYNAASALTAHQENLVHFLETNLTWDSDASRHGLPTPPVKPPKNSRKPAPTASRWLRARVYAQEFCPLLPPNKEFLGALGHFRHNPECGFTLFGTSRHKSPHPTGLVVEAGYYVPNVAQWLPLAQQVLADLHEVVVVHWEGLICGQVADKWLCEEEFSHLPPELLYHQLRLFCFLPINYQARERKRWEDYTNRRATDNAQEAEQARWGLESELSRAIYRGTTENMPIPKPENGFRGLTLPQRLAAMMEHKKLKRKDVAALFGVTPPNVTYWLDPRVIHEKNKRREIPETLAPLVIRWLETGQAPTAEELAARKRPASPPDPNRIKKAPLRKRKP